MASDNNHTRAGVLYAVLAYTLWGALPLYWKSIHNVSSIEILAHRILWSCVCYTLLSIYNGQWQNEAKSVLTNRKTILLVVLASITITVNSGVYIWAVNSGHVIESSMGYYINPLVIVLIGVLFFKEKLNQWQIAALALASIGVVLMTVQYGRVPWVSLILAFSFALYGALKKYIKVSSLLGLAMETAMLTPFVLMFITSRQLNGIGALGNISLPGTLLLLGSGMVTALPMFLFTKSARMIPLSTLGFIQYISPSISLLLSVFVFHENFSSTHAISFGFIWCGLILYSISLNKVSKAALPQSIQAAE